MKGRKPTPTKMLKARGSRWANDRPDEPTPQRIYPEAPATLTDEIAMNKWREMAQVLDEMDVVTRPDCETLVRYCNLYSTFEKAQVFLNAQESQVYPVEDKYGNVVNYKPWPQIKITLDTSAQMLRMEQDFGMTPSSRTRVQTLSSQTLEENDEGRFFER